MTDQTPALFPARDNSVAAAFTNVVTSFVSDIILPPLSVLLPLNANLDFKFAVLQAGQNYERWGGYNTIEQAQDDGAVIMAYGVFLNKTLNFIGLGLALYALAGLYQYLSRSPIIKHTTKCRYCRGKVFEEVSAARLAVDAWATSDYSVVRVALHLSSVWFPSC